MKLASLFGLNESIFDRFPVLQIFKFGALDEFLGALTLSERGTASGSGAHRRIFRSAARRCRDGSVAPAGRERSVVRTRPRPCPGDERFVDLETPVR